MFSVLIWFSAGVLACFISGGSYVPFQTLPPVVGQEISIRLPDSQKEP